MCMCIYVCECVYMCVTTYAVDGQGGGEAGAALEGGGGVGGEGRGQMRFEQKMCEIEDLNRKCVKFWREKGGGSGT